MQNLIIEARTQQEIIDVLLDRGQRFLAQRANIVLEVDLENLVFLWNSYVDDIRKLHFSIFKSSQRDLSSRDSQLDTKNVKAVDYNRDLSDQLSSQPVEKISFRTSTTVVEEIPSASSLGCNNKQPNNCDFEKSNSNLDISFDSLGSTVNYNQSDDGNITLADLATANPPLEISDLVIETLEEKSVFHYLESTPNIPVNTVNTPVPHDEDVSESHGYDPIIQSENNVKESTIASEDTSDQINHTMAEYISSSEKFSMDGRADCANDVSNEDLSFKISKPLVTVMSDDKSGKNQLTWDSAESLRASSEMLGFFAKGMPLSGSPIEPKRRKVLLPASISASTLSSRSNSPLSLNLDDSGSNTPTGTLTSSDKRDEMWKTIDHFMLDKGIIEACKVISFSIDKNFICIKLFHKHFLMIIFKKIFFSKN